MSRHLKSVVMVAVVSFCVLAPMVGGVHPAASQRRGAQPDSPGHSVTVLVEAFVVEVDLVALAALGVSPIGQAPHAVSVENVLECLSNEQASVIAAARAAVQCDNRSSSVEVTRTTYTEQSIPTPQPVRRHSSQSSGQKFAVDAKTPSGQSVAVDYTFSCSFFEPAPEANGRPRDHTDWEWSGRIGLALGAPAIAAATQNRENAVFLILVAHPAGKQESGV